MNCKKGDLAIVVNSGPATRWALGRIVVCAELSASLNDWVLEQPLMSPDKPFTSWPVISDDYLRRIGDPGDDVQDETLQWLALPHSAGMVA